MKKVNGRRPIIMGEFGETHGGSLSTTA